MAAANKTGRYALRLASTATATKVRSDPMPCTEGRRYHFLIEFQASTTTASRTVTIDVEWCDSTQSTTATQTLYNAVVTTADTWQCIRAQLAPPNGARFVRVSVTKAAYAFAVIVDRVRIDEVSNALDDAMNEIVIADDFVKDGTGAPWGDLGWSEFAFTNVTVSKQGAAAASFDPFSEVGVVQIQAGTTNGTGGGLLLGSLSRAMFYGLPPVGFELRMKLRAPTTTTGFIAWAGLWSSTSVDPDVGGANTISGIGFRAVTTGGAANWYGVVRTGTTETTVDLGKGANTTWRTLGWRRTPTGVQFQVGDYDVGSEVTTNLPATTITMNPIMAILTTAGAVTHELQCDKVGLRAFSNRLAA
jgi:hypothetical protein